MLKIKSQLTKGFMFNSKLNTKKEKIYRNQNKKKKGRDLIVILACDEDAELRTMMIKFEVDDDGEGWMRNMIMCEIW